VAFEAVNVEGNPAALAELKRLGAPLVPAVAVGERVVHGWNPQGVAALVGVEYRERERLAPEELARRLDTILGASQRAICQVPDDRLDMKSPDRDRTVRDLGYHIFRLSLAFRDGMAERRFPEVWLQETAPPEIGDGAAIASYGETVRKRLAEWFGRPGAWEGVVETYYGPQSGHELLERTTWHAAQHLRQLYALIEMMGLAPDRPLGEKDFAGLPLPKALW
jgi:hypothetical protein